MPKCPACGATRLEDVGHLIRCAQCSTEFDRYLRPYGPMRSAPNPPPILGDETMPTMVQSADLHRFGGRDDSTHIDLSDEIPTDPRAQESAPRAQFAPPPPTGPASPFAAPPSHEALSREAKGTGYTHSVGDGGPPPGLDLLVLILLGVDALSLLLWWRSDAPLASVLLLPLLASILITYFFWKGRNWARFLLITGSMIEIAGLALAFAMVRDHMTGPEMLGLAIRFGLDVYVCWFCARPDTSSFYEKRSGRR